MTTWPFFKLTPTRFGVQNKHELFYGHQKGWGWRYVIRDESGYAQVGLTYQSKDELLNDLQRYAESWGMT